MSRIASEALFLIARFTINRNNINEPRENSEFDLNFSLFNCSLVACFLVFDDDNLFLDDFFVLLDLLAHTFYSLLNDSQRVQ